ncbi:MAG: hypothetical protein ABI199_08845 [Bacteroidia bacterium]
MKIKKIIFGSLFFLFFISGNTSAQSDVSTVIRDLLQQNKYAAADSTIDVYMKKYPDNPDVLLMKGNVALNDFMQSNLYVSSTSDTNESIYQPDIANDNPPALILNKEAAKTVAEYWLKALAIKPDRMDIRKSLCYIYSASLLKDELIKQLDELKNEEKDSKKLMFEIDDYAAMFFERQALDAGIEVYKKMTTYFPEEASIYSDIAGAYFQNGNLVLAKKYISEALKKQHLDVSIYNNAFFIHAVLGYYQDAKNDLKAADTLEHSNKALFYQGMLEYAKNNILYKKTFTDFIQKADTSVRKEDIMLANYLQSDSNKNDYDSYLKSLNYLPQDAYALLLHKRAMKLFPGKYNPAFSYGEIETYNKNYNAAIEAFKTINLKGILSDSLSEQFNLCYGWALQASGQTKEADSKWKLIENSKNFYGQSAAIYFLGKNLFDRGEKDQAKIYFLKISDRATDSKYATFATNYLEKYK